MENTKKDQRSDMHWSCVISKSLHALDLSMSRKLAICSEPSALRPIMMILELSGHGIPWIGGTILFLYKATSLPEQEVFFNLLLALVLDLILLGLLKGIFHRPRPVYNKRDMFATVSLDNFSFPSGHATRAVMLTVFFLHHLKLSIVLRTILLSWAFCVSLSRIVLGRHYVSDVVAGIIIGYLQYVWILQSVWFSSDTVSYLLSLVNF